MNWKLRYEGSPDAVEGLTPEQIVQGVQDGDWEPTDEVRGPGDTAWRSIEAHPQFEAALADYEPPAAPPHPDETRLDMNPLIDVSLVLLIFFILTTTYAEMRKKFRPPAVEHGEVKQAMGEGDLRRFTIRVTARMEDGAPVIRVEDEVVPESELQAKIVEWKSRTGQSRLATEIDKNVPWEIFMAIQDAAAGAKIVETIRIERPPAPE